MLTFYLKWFWSQNGKSFLDYYDAKGEKYFYEFLKPLADVTNLTDEDFIDWEMLIIM
jgi:hypothetical protein